MIDGHGDDSYKYRQPITSNFSSNVYNKVDLSGLQAHLCSRMASISAYPEPEPYTLEKRLAARCGLPPASVCVTNGATEAIYLIAQTFRGTHTAVRMPTFSEYADACRMHGHRLTSLYTLDKLPDDVHILWLCNPNNPTGEVYDKGRLRQLIKNHPQVCFIIDQSYEYFTLKELFTPGEAAEYPNVILLHSMTKRYAIPGLRLGYITAHAGLLERLRANRMPWSVNQLAIEAGLYLLEEGVPQAVGMETYLAECARLRGLLEALGGVKVWPTDTHFMLARLRVGKAAALKEYLANEHGMLIRDASNFEGLDETYFRIATQTPEENDRLVAAIGEWMKL